MCGGELIPVSLKQMQETKRTHTTFRLHLCDEVWSCVAIVTWLFKAHILFWYFQRNTDFFSQISLIQFNVTSRKDLLITYSTDKLLRVILHFCIGDCSLWLKISAGPSHQKLKSNSHKKVTFGNKFKPPLVIVMECIMWMLHM